MAVIDNASVSNVPRASINLWQRLDVSYGNSPIFSRRKSDQALVVYAEELDEARRNELDSFRELVLSFMVHDTSCSISSVLL